MWHRQYLLDSYYPASSQERWSRSIDPFEEVELSVRFGKPLNIATLRESEPGAHAQAIADLSQEVSHLYSIADLQVVSECPACGFLWRPSDSFPIHGITYAICSMCGHATVEQQPPPDVMQQRFIESTSLALPYTNQDITEFRIEQIAIPKLTWLLEYYGGFSGRAPRRILDVGAGAGHFVEACHRRGIDAEGVELSHAARQFALETFGLTLGQGDFLAGETHYSDVDVITLWGLLEYVSDPHKFLQVARSAVASDGMVVVEVPRIDSLSSWVQRSFPNNVSRHLDPASHLNCFSDSSLMEILFRSNLKPVALWYFGMDFYELLTQIQLSFGQSNPLNPASEALNPIQQGLDRHLFSDDVIVIAKPV